MVGILSYMGWRQDFILSLLLNFWRINFSLPCQKIQNKLKLLKHLTVLINHKVSKFRPPKKVTFLYKRGRLLSKVDLLKSMKFLLWFKNKVIKICDRISLRLISPVHFTSGSQSTFLCGLAVAVPQPFMQIMILMALVV